MHGLVQRMSPLSTTTRIDRVSDSALLRSKPHLHLFLFRACLRRLTVVQPDSLLPRTSHVAHECSCSSNFATASVQPLNQPVPTLPPGDSQLIHMIFR